jgi:glycosyltransferase involved in cell wall biosynthesis
MPDAGAHVDRRRPTIHVPTASVSGSPTAGATTSRLPAGAEPGEPTVTVYIPCRNYGRYLTQAIESVVAQLFRSWELIIVDEGSDDETSTVAEAWARQHPGRIQLIRHEHPQGLQRVANEVLRRARGRFIMRLDADDWLDEGALLLLVAKMEADQGVGIVYGNFFYTNADGQVIGVERRRNLGSEDRSGHLPPHGACTLVRTRLLKSLGGYSEDVDAQDGWELWFKLIGVTRAAAVDAPVFYYRQHITSLSRNSDRLLNARARIFEKVRRQGAGSYVPTTLAVIPVRESFPQWSDVPFQRLRGRTLLQHTLDAACGVADFTSIAVSSDSAAVLEACTAYAAEQGEARLLAVPRPPDLATPSFQFRQVLLHAARQHAEAHGNLPDVVAYLSLHSPLRASRDVQTALHMLHVTRADSVVSVVEETDLMFTHGTSGLDLVNPGRFDELIHERERLFRFCGAFIVCWREVLEAGSTFGTSIAHMELSRLSGSQVRTPSELALLEHQLELVG